MNQTPQQPLSQSLALYRVMVEALPGCVLSVDTLGIVRFANQYASQLLGAGGMALEGRSFLTLYDTQSRRDLTQALRAIEFQQIVHDLETRHELAGSARTIRWTLTRLHHEASDAGGEVAAGLAKVMVLAHGLDVTHRLEREQRDAENDAMAMMGTLATGLAHEIRNPLNAANLQLELLLRRAERIGDAHLASRLGGPAALIRTAIGRLAVTLDEFLEVARPREPVRRVCSVAELFQSVLALQQPLIESVGVDLHSYICEDGLAVRCDAAKIAQVLTNLIRNSVDALGDRDSGRVLIHAERRAEGGVAISVLDDGHGVADSMRGDAAFEPFSTTKAAGTGLGLSIARKIVSQHGGAIALSTRPGVGTAARFWISD